MEGNTNIGMTIAMIVATLVGPVLAVQAQKWVERARARNRAQDDLFRTLYATRAQRLSFEHVRALNTIDLAFSHKRFAGFQWPDAKLDELLKRWQRYLDELGTPPADQTQAAIVASNRARDDRFNDLLGSMSTYLGYHIDERILRQRLYFPTGHSTMEDEMRNMRHSIIDVFSGRRALRVDMRAEQGPILPDFRPPEPHDEPR